MLVMKTVIEFRLFTRLAEGRLDDTQLRDLVDLVSANPNTGDLIPGGGGARKLRWSAEGRGKRGGSRVIFYWHCDACPVYLITIYLKNERADLSQKEIQQLFEVSKELANVHQAS